MATNGLILINGRTLSDKPAQPTFCSHNGSIVIGLVWVSASAICLVRDLYMRVDVSLSDHIPVVLELWDDSGGEGSERAAGDSTNTPCCPSCNGLPLVARRT